MNENYKIIKNQITRFSFEKLQNNQAPMERLEELYEKNKTMIHDALKPEHISAAVIYSFLREHKLNRKGGITIQQLAEYFDVKPQAVTSNVFDVDCIINRTAIFPEDNGYYEFIDEGRFESSEAYYEFLESTDSNDYKKSEKILLDLIKKDPYFLDTYTSLHEYYLENNQGSKAFDIMFKAHNKAISLIINKNEKFPDSLPWRSIENRHIIRAMFHFAAILWLNRDTKNALLIFQMLLKSDSNDNIGVRYMIVAMCEKVKSLYHFKEKFESDWQAQEEWFVKAVQKHKNVIGWWLELDESK